MNKILFSVFAALLLCGCRTTLPKEPPVNFQEIILTDHIPVAKTYSAEPWIPGTLPIPMDRLMLAVKRELPAGSQPGIIFPDDDSLITEYNRYAAKKIFSGAAFDPVKERSGFLKEKAGNASKILLEYFRIIERRTLFEFVYTGLEQRRPGIQELFHTNILKEPETILKKGLNRKVYSRKEVHVIRKELKFYQTRKENIGKILQKKGLSIIAGSGKWSLFKSRTGAPVTLKSGVKVDISPDRKAMILHLFAEEPMMGNRNNTITKRDDPAAWRDECFEIFLVPNPEQPENNFQLTITSGGILTDRSRKKDRVSTDLSWNISGKAVVVRQEKSWEATITIPWKDFGLDGMPEKPFLANFYRHRAQKKKRLTISCWSPIYFGEHLQVKRFGPIVWEDK